MTLEDIRNNAVLRHLDEYLPSTKSRMEMVLGPELVHPTPPAHDDEYDIITNMLEYINRINVEPPLARWHMAGFVQESPAWETHLKDAATVRDIILVIRLFGSSPIAERLDYLNGLPADEPDQKPMSLESVKGFAFFIMNNTWLPYPDITINPDGRVSIDWGETGRSTLILELLSSEYVEYLEVFRRPESARQRQYASGVSRISNIMDIIGPAMRRQIRQ